MSEEDHAAQERAAKAQKALDRAADGAKAMAEYEAGRAAVEVNTARLRALRLEKERAERQASAAAAVRPKAAGRKARAEEPA
ncbi:transcriptional regulator [Enterovirga aerilata]|uniref:Transcriptional regulator n=1 Tax=Enterovirga aerilata TaxID=2730920 RepID=A0A849HV35_9HYPH|nr:transcriptional regulator [Enterovirga sp. DB1703]NNM70972.1 transcriptional regulator [Enterovirga sp. DB1703]